jgi:methyl-accepting chemotaxis protein
VSGNQANNESETYTAEQLQPLLQALQAAKDGDFSVRLPAPRDGVLSEICKAFNDVTTKEQHNAKVMNAVSTVVTAIANGVFSLKITEPDNDDAKALIDTINNMTETVSIFAEQVTTVARGLGTEGILGRQAEVPGAAGTWRDLTDNFNFMAGNLTTQLRGIGLVARAVADGDTNQRLTMEARGEVLELRNNINAMIEKIERLESAS